LHGHHALVFVAVIIVVTFSTTITITTNTNTTNNNTNTTDSVEEFLSSWQFTYDIYLTFNYTNI
jgi:hypothetical protein